MRATLVHLEGRLRELDAMPSRLAGTQWQPTARQVADYRSLIGSPRFTPEERARAERWLEQSATVNTIPLKSNGSGRSSPGASRPPSSPAS